MNDPNLAGASDADKRIWNSYVYWARSAFGLPPSDLAISNPELRLPAEEEKLLHAIVFAVFALEYRLRSVYMLLNLSVRRHDGVMSLLDNLEHRTKGIERKGKQITFPNEWKKVRGNLKKLVELRNHIAHGKRQDVSKLLRDAKPPLKAQAVEGYNALVDAIRIINVAISYDTKTGADLTKYYAKLQLEV
jgi:hypothetical protein